MFLKADRRDYKRGYKKHIQLYKCMKDRDAFAGERRLLLCYAVECGLKCLLLIKWNIWDTDKIQEKYKREMIGTHDLEKMIKELGQQGNYHFVKLKTKHQENVNAGRYHQLYRYGILLDDHEAAKEKNMEKMMETMADWIEERM